MKLLLVSSILILSRNVVTFGSSIRVSELEGNEEEQQRQQMNRKLEVTVSVRCLMMMAKSFLRHGTRLMARAFLHVSLFYLCGPESLC